MQTCIWPSGCHCHSLSLASVKSRLVLPFWHRLARVVPNKGPLNGCVCVHDACEFFCRLRNWSYVYIFYSPKLVVQTRIIYENKVKKGKKSLDIVLDNDTAYLTDYTYFRGIFILCDKGCLIISMGVNGWMFLLVPDHPGQVFPDKGPLNGCVCLILCGFSDMAWLFLLVYWLHLQCSQNSDFSASNK